MSQLNNRLGVTEAAAPLRDSRSLASAAMRSEALLGGQDSLLILHQNETYILRKTRAGKLILTK